MLYQEQRRHEQATERLTLDPGESRVLLLLRRAADERERERWEEPRTILDIVSCGAVWVFPISPRVLLLSPPTLRLFDLAL